VSTAPATSLKRIVLRAEGLRSEARAWWESYLWHHRRPLTRRLHRAGSWTCIGGFAATGLGYGWGWTPLAIVVGYLFAFSGHYFVERNRPLTFDSPLRAGVANWVMFFYEMFWDVEADLLRLSEDPPDTSDWGSN
jgi:hypothetical protein